MDQVRRLEPLLPLALATFALALLVTLSRTWSRTRRGASVGQALSASLVDVLLVSSLVLVVILILGPARTPPGRRLDLIPFRELQPHGFDRKSALFEMAGNVLLFVPISFLTALRFPALRSWRIILDLGLGLSLLLEGLQFVLNTGREASVTDVLFNILGSLLGYALFLVATGGRARWRTRYLAARDL
jgi:glycopeptide antibiotics resistance protein